jgi:hypothetical protein
VKSLGEKRQCEEEAAGGEKIIEGLQARSGDARERVRQRRYGRACSEMADRRMEEPRRADNGRNARKAMEGQGKRRAAGTYLYLVGAGRWAWNQGAARRGAGGGVRAGAGARARGRGTKQEERKRNCVSDSFVERGLFGPAVWLFFCWLSSESQGGERRAKTPTTPIRAPAQGAHLASVARTRYRRAANSPHCCRPRAAAQHHGLDGRHHQQQPQQQQHHHQHTSRHRGAPSPSPSTAPAPAPAPARPLHGPRRLPLSSPGPWHQS